MPAGERADVVRGLERLRTGQQQHHLGVPQDAVGEVLDGLSSDALGEAGRKDLLQRVDHPRDRSAVVPAGQLESQRGIVEDQAVQHAKSWGHKVGGRGAEFVFQTRARSDSLNRCLQALRPQGTVIDLAFYQGGMDGLRLGEEFHHNGLSIRCAQINRMPRQLAHAWDQRRLAQETLHLLADEGDLIREHMITHVVPYDDAPGFLRHLVQDRPEFLQIVFAHE